MSSNETQGWPSDDGIARHRYLDILHQFTLRQSALTTLDDIVWNIAKTAIAELGFEDCVVYLLSDDGTYLQQVAAHGPKNPVDREIYNEITIPVGAGVVGHVAKTGEVQCIADCRLDSRYITDDSFRLSELAVPISHGNRIIGVLDSEHHDVDFFSHEDAQLFTTIAALASNRIDAALAMQRLENTVETLEEARAKLELQTEDLKQARRAAEAASTAKTHFLANMSHEIRTPMTSIVGFAELLASRRGNREQQQQWQGQLTRNARYLQDLIGNILDMAAVESGTIKVESEAFSLKSTVIDAVEILRMAADDKGLVLRAQGAGLLPEKIISDRVKLREIVVNLVSNAVKYTQTGSVTICLTAKQIEREAWVQIQVTDTGIGIEESQIVNLFKPFSRVHDRRRWAGVEGTGLGLALTHQFVEALGGTLQVDSTLGEGSVFTVQVPAGLPEGVHWLEQQPSNPFQTCDLSPAPPAANLPRDSEQSLKNLHVLFCEDSDSVALLIEVLLAAAGARITRCVNGLQGLEHFKNMTSSGEPPDLVLMDMQMPEMDGYEATGHIKQLAKNVPVVALTAFALTEDFDRCMAAGCDHYVSKPVQAASFATQLGEFLARFGAARPYGDVFS